MIVRSRALGSRLRRRRLLLPCLLVGVLAPWLLGASATDPAPAEGPVAQDVGPEGFDPPLAEMSGKDIYQRVLDNRFDSYTQVSSLLSGDRAGNDQETRLKMWFQSFRGPDRQPIEGIVLSKSMVKYTHPFDIRHSGYLIINNLNRANDQFLYRSSDRRVRRVNLRGEAVFGTDFSFEDVVPKEIEDADYERLSDTEVDGIPCYRVVAIPRPYTNSEYSRILVTVEKERPVTLRSDYWDDREIHVKEMKVDPTSIRLLKDIWVPHEMTMTNLRHDTYTKLRVVEIDPNPALARNVFDLRRLEGH